MPNEKHALKVFLCHAHADRDAVRALYARLKREGVDVWLDKEKLLPGADWELEIRKAVREADVVVVCLSKQFNQAGFRQKEVRLALDTAMEKPEGEIFIIPARLEECDTPDSLSRWHWVDLFESDGYQRLLLALRVRADKIGAALRQRGRTISRPHNADQEAEKAKQDAAEKARLNAEERERQRLAKEQADRETAEKAKRDAAEKARLDAEERKKHKKAERRKTPRKPNPAVILGGIGLIGVMFVVILASGWGKWFPAAPEPTATLSFASTKTKTSTATPYPDEITDAKGVTMRLVPAGKFTMGSENGDDDEKPVHEVYLDAFYMDIYEVTNALYKACVEAGGCTPPQNTRSYSRDSYYGNSEFDDYPVIYVNWNMAKTYCEWRGASLPTEAQWEKAARGTDGRTYPWGEGIDCDKANYWGKDGGCVGDTTPVGSYASGKSPYGIYDLAGNVWEWVNDWYDSAYYQGSPSSNPMGPISGQSRVLRGGSWSYLGSDVRASVRDWYVPASGSNIGFRCARSP